MLAVEIDGEWHEIDEVGEGSEVAPATSCGCGALYLTFVSDGRHRSLRCPMCGQDYPVAYVARYRLGSGT
jgi:hypothetical protein